MTTAGTADSSTELCGPARRHKFNDARSIEEDNALPRGEKSTYSSKQKRKARHIEQSYEARGVVKSEAEARAWATVNKQSGGGEKSGGGRRVSASRKRAARRDSARRAASARRGKPLNRGRASAKARHPRKAAAMRRRS